MARLIVVSATHPYQTITDIACSIEEGNAMAATINRQHSVVGRPAMATCIPDTMEEDEQSGRREDR
ncbi:hypothetical protein HH310_09775 [Actinoplanes sp. TBRC 11911]|uniref:hypothetical protein n=1 Tax=Actinoplanes sp. TBRC 11911 TaxID=2729386 RepID=UPI00145EF637|nr:hypothetical protein [Actinoplanes sp. TBRC 11911]NMO51477.1 hypothetical protein [Actinoplanes sp. TBRC 11911]